MRQSSEDSLFLEGAIRIGKRLVSSALTEERRTTWSVVVLDQARRSERATREEPAGPALYQGAAGIGLFLTELYRHTGERSFAITAGNALRHSIDRIDAVAAAPFGFYSGQLGICYALARFGLISGESEFEDKAREVLGTLRGTERQDRFIDAIAGAAGAIPILLCLSSWLDEPEYRAIAVALGDHLVDVAVRRPQGWSWRPTKDRDTNALDLAGFAHGAAGCSHALVQLFAATKDDRYRYAAEQGFSYERTLFEASEGNWIDCRNAQLDDAMSTVASRKALRESLRSGAAAPTYTTRSIVAWCHGATGIGLSRLHAMRLLSNEIYEQEARIAAATVDRVNAAFQNYSLCHGIFGNDFFLREASRLLQVREWGQRARIRAETALKDREFSFLPWPGGTPNYASDPSLMLGDAGIGYYFLSYVDASLPPLLCPTNGMLNQDSAAEQDWLAPVDQSVELLEHASLTYELRTSYISKFFSKSIAIFDRFRPGELDARVLKLGHRPGSEVASFHVAIRDLLAVEANSDIAIQLRDAALPELHRYEMSVAARDYTDTLMADLSRPDLSEIDWESSRFQLARTALVCEQLFDWDEWMSSAQTSGPRRHEFRRGVLLNRRGGEINLHPLKPLGFAVLRALRDEPLRVNEIVSRLQEQEPFPARNDESISPLVREQVKSGYKAGAVALQ